MSKKEKINLHIQILEEAELKGLTPPSYSLHRILSLTDELIELNA